MIQYIFSHEISRLILVKNPFLWNISIRNISLFTWSKNLLWLRKNKSALRDVPLFKKKKESKRKTEQKKELQKTIACVFLSLMALSLMRVVIFLWNISICNISLFMWSKNLLWLRKNKSAFRDVPLFKKKKRKKTKTAPKKKRRSRRRLRVFLFYL